MMKAEIAATDPNTQITKHIGSGPFKFIESEYRDRCSRVVYERNPDYVPRSEPASGIAGGKRGASSTSVIWDIIPDAQTAASALMAGEVDFFEVPPIDILPTLTAAPGIKTEVFSKLGNVGLGAASTTCTRRSTTWRPARRRNWPINQEDIQRAAVGNTNYYRTCGSHFTCGSADGCRGRLRGTDAQGTRWPSARPRRASCSSSPAMTASPSSCCTPPTST